jgi:hypothetical protein
LDEWEKMRDPNYQQVEAKEVRPPGAEQAAADITRDTAAFTASIRNRIFSFIRGLINEEWEQALANLSSVNQEDGQTWTPGKLKQIVEEYHIEHQRICLDPNARNLRHTYVTKAEDNHSWRVQQMLVDPEEHNDWVAEFEVDIIESRKEGSPILKLRRIGSLA